MLEHIEAALNKSTVIDKPFKVRIVDNFLPEDVFSKCVDVFPHKEDSSWETSILEGVERKRRTTWGSVYDIPPHIVDVVQYLNSSLFLNRMSEMLDIPKLISDPYYAGGGLNESFRGDYLDVHVDGNYHDATGLHRRANAIFYLNTQWDTDWGGCFEVYDQEGDRCVHKVEPIGNRLVVFDTSDTSFHGFPDPIQPPENISRRSLLLYYYTKAERPTHQTKVREPHSALWKKNKFMDKNGNLTRDYT